MKLFHSPKSYLYGRLIACMALVLGGNEKGENAVYRQTVLNSLIQGSFIVCPAGGRNIKIQVSGKPLGLCVTCEPWCSASFGSYRYLSQTAVLEALPFLFSDL